MERDFYSAAHASFSFFQLFCPPCCCSLIGCPLAHLLTASARRCSLKRCRLQALNLHYSNLRCAAATEIHERAALAAMEDANGGSEALSHAFQRWDS